MVEFSRRSSARVAALAIGLLLVAGLLLISRVAVPEAANAAPADATTTATAAAAAKGRCPKARVRYTEATGGTTQFGWLLQPGPSTTEQRDWLQYNVVPGSLVCDSVTLTNSSKNAVSVQLYPADAYNIADDGGFAFTAFKDKPQGVGTWIRLPVKRVTVPSGRAAVIPIVVRVPAKVSPGDTAGGVVARDTRVQHGQEVDGVDVGVRAGVGVRLYAQVAGIRDPKLSLTKLKLDLPGGFKSWIVGADSATVSYQVGNAGNVRLSPTSKGTVKTRTKTVPLVTHEFPNLLPGSPKIVVKEKVKGLRWGSLTGRVCAKVTVTAEGADPVTREVTVWRVPWLSLAGGTSLLVVGGGVWYVRRRNRIPAVNLATEEAPEALEPAGR